MISFLLALASLSQSPSDGHALKPPVLKTNETVGLIAPASPLDEASVRGAVRYLRQAGYGVKLSYGYRQAQGYLAGSDESRAAELNAMFRDPQVKAIVCLRGGYGSPRILDRIDYALLEKNPKVLVGYSDITALLNAIHAKTAMVVFHGPMAKELSEGLTPFTSRYFWSAFQPRSALFDDWGHGLPESKSRLTTVVPGQAEGVLVGGNLSVVTCTLGTPYEIKTQGAILFLEEVSEKPYRIDRMLNHLRLSGKLAQVRGVLLCRFTNCEPAAENDSGLETIFKDYFGELGVPVLAGFPAGHVPDQVTLPVGIRVRLDATARKLTLLESTVTTAEPK